MLIEKNDRKAVMTMIANRMTGMDYSLRWWYVYSEIKDAIICVDSITGAWYRVPGRVVWRAGAKGGA